MTTTTIAGVDLNGHDVAGPVADYSFGPNQYWGTAQAPVAAMPNPFYQAELYLAQGIQSILIQPDATLSDLGGVNLNWHFSWSSGPSLPFGTASAATPYTTQVNNVSYALTATPVARVVGGATYYDLLVQSATALPSDVMQQVVRNIRLEYNRSAPIPLHDEQVTFTVSISSDGTHYSGANATQAGRMIVDFDDNHPTLVLAFHQDNRIAVLLENGGLISGELADAQTNSNWNFGTPDLSRFSVTVNGVDVRIKNVVMKDDLILVLENAIPAAAQVRVSYRDSAGDQVVGVAQTWHGNDVASGSLTSRAQSGLKVEALESLDGVFSAVEATGAGRDFLPDGDGLGVQQDTPGRVSAVTLDSFTVEFVPTFFVANPAYDPGASTGFASYRYVNEAARAVLKRVPGAQYAVGQSYALNNLITEAASLEALSATTSAIVSNQMTGAPAKVYDVGRVTSIDGGWVSFPLLILDMAWSNNLLVGSPLYDGMTGGWGNDTLVGGGGGDSMAGGLGDDVYMGFDSLDGVSELANGGTDTLVTEQPYVDLIDHPFVENLTYQGRNTAIRHEIRDWILPDWLSTMGGVYVTELIGSELNNRITGGTGADWLEGGGGSDTLIGGEGNDAFSGFYTYDDDEASADPEFMRLLREQAPYTDRMEGGAGNDLYLLDHWAASSTSIIELPGGGTDMTMAGDGFVMPDNVEINVNDSSKTDGNVPVFVTVTGNSIGNLMSTSFEEEGWASMERFYGMGGNDTFAGAGGNDWLDGGEGVDTAQFRGLRSHYSWVVDSQGQTLITDLRSGSPDGTDTLVSTEWLQFSDQRVENTAGSAGRTLSLDLNGSDEAGTPYFWMGPDQYWGTSSGPVLAQHFPFAAAEFYVSQGVRSFRIQPNLTLTDLGGAKFDWRLREGSASALLAFGSPAAAVSFQSSVDGQTYSLTAKSEARVSGGKTYYDLVVTSADELPGQVMQQVLSKVQLQYNRTGPIALHDGELKLAVQISTDGIQYAGAGPEQAGFVSLELRNTRPFLGTAFHQDDRIAVTFKDDKHLTGDLANGDSWSFGGPDLALFTVTVNGVPATIKSLHMDGDLVLVMASAIPAGAQVEVAYNDPAGDQISGVAQTWEGNDALSGKVQSSATSSGLKVQAIAASGLGLFLEGLQLDFNRYLDDRAGFGDDFALNVVAIGQDSVTLKHVPSHFLPNPLYDPTAGAGYKSYRYSNESITLELKKVPGVSYAVGDSYSQAWLIAEANSLQTLGLTTSLIASQQASGMPAATFDLSKITSLDGATRPLPSFAMDISWSDNLMVGGALADNFTGGLGHDTLQGGAGADTLAGGSGDDVYLGFDAEDVVVERDQQGNDTLVTDLPHVDLIDHDFVESLTYQGKSTAVRVDKREWLTTEEIALFGGQYVTELVGSELNNRITGGTSSDWLEGGGGSDTLYGGAGNDVLQGFYDYDDDEARADAIFMALLEAQAPYTDWLYGGPGNDIYPVDSWSYSKTSIVELPGEGTDMTMAGDGFVMPDNVEINVNDSNKTNNGVPVFVTVTGNSGGNLMSTSLMEAGWASMERFYGMAGHDTLVAHGGNDWLDGGAGTDTSTYRGQRSDYNWTTDAQGQTLITDLRAGSPDGTDTLVSVEWLRFADQRVLLDPNASAGLQGMAYHWKSHTLMSDVKVAVAERPASTPPANLLESTTGADGVYGFDSLAAGAYQLSASKPVTVDTAINSADALAALKIAVGRNPNSSGAPVSPYQFMSADINGDGKVTSADALSILKMAVRRVDAPAREWLLVDDRADFWNETTKAFTTTRSLVEYDKGVNLSSPERETANLVAVLKGDVNGSWAGPAGSQSLDAAMPNYLKDLATTLGVPASQWAVL